MVAPTISEVFGLRDQHLEDDRRNVRAHRLRGFNHAGINFKQRRLNHAGDIRRGRNDKGNDRRCRAVSLARNRAGDGDDQNHQNQKRNRTEDVHDHIQQAVDQLLRLEAARRGQNKQNRNRQTEQIRKQRGDGRHVQRILDAAQHQRNHLIHGHGRSPPQRASPCFAGSKSLFPAASDLPAAAKSSGRTACR